MTKALAIIDQSQTGQPQTAQPLSWVHLGGTSLTGTHKAYKVAATDSVLDALESEAACVLLLRLSEGEPELDAENANMLAVFNQFMAAQGLPTFEDGTTPRQVLAAIGVDVAGYDVSDAEDGIE
jgi:predicted Ser/Thr protein kinase